jgi:hypothetical protein
MALLVLSLLTLVESFPDFGPTCRTVDSIQFMLIPLGLLYRIQTKVKSRQMERYIERIGDLERALAESRTNSSKEPVDQHEHEICDHS